MYAFSSNDICRCSVGSRGKNLKAEMATTLAAATDTAMVAARAASAYVEVMEGRATEVTVVLPLVNAADTSK